MISSGKIQQFIFWLQSHRLINVLLVAVYFLLMIISHDTLVGVSVFIENKLGVEGYNMAVAVVFLVIAIAVSFVLIRFLLSDKSNLFLKLFYALAGLLLLVIHSRFMFDSNIEVIHAFGFSGLAFLLFPFTRRFGAAVFFTLPFMLFDEWYQYIILYPELIDYYDLNDILMDTYGCGLMMSALMISGIKSSSSTKPFWQREEFFGLVGFVIVVCLATNYCFIAPYASDVCDNTLLIVNKSLAVEPFWRPHPTHNIVYHVMKPAEGLIAIALLHFFYFGMDGYLGRDKAGNN